jgi:hypothetical protein
VLTLFEEIITVYTKNYAKYFNTERIRRLLIFQAGGTYSYQWALKANSTHLLSYLNSFHKFSCEANGIRTPSVPLILDTFKNLYDSVF